MPPPRSEQVGWPRRRPRPLLWLVVLLAHLLLVGGWRQGLRPNNPAPAQETPGRLVWLDLPPVPTVAPPRQTPAAPHPPGPAPVRQRPSAQPPTTAPREAPAAPAPTTLTAVAAEPPASAASAPREKLLDSSATRLAIRQAARQPLLAERAAEATGLALARSDQALASGVAQSAKGDCLKGEYAGGGMGLLSVPFALVAVARGQCAR